MLICKKLARTPEGCKVYIARKLGERRAEQMQRFSFSVPRQKLGNNTLHTLDRLV